VPARDLEGHDDAVPDGDVRDLAADLLDDAHRLVAEHVALGHERPEDLVEGARPAGQRGLVVRPALPHG
jgi:hypothetical protein